MLQHKLDKNLIKKIENYMFYDKETMETFNQEWRQKMRTTNCFLFNVFNNSRCDHYKFNETPCWYCSAKGRSSANSHSVFECIRYHRDLNNLSNKLSNSFKN